MIKRDYSEKRDFIRMTINTPAEVHVEQEGIVAQGVCNDLSGSGMLLTVNHVLPVNSELMVTLLPEDKNEPMFQARCIIARSLKAAEDKCLLGLEILEVIDDKDMQAAS
jgi:hypothetical protein